jgi:hypothetical protein
MIISGEMFATFKWGMLMRIKHLRDLDSLSTELSSS